ncbi:uncharacterized protein LOC128500969 [Spea bombifrons]|uniref:uncharacterized protein LOC128500969 n=1 Tax=Spea bombifrons TaxID=233779 RepID=UPI00234A98F2|nr:uncharacterized protein LOC128500969 [Spea bombifrons]
MDEQTEQTTDFKSLRETFQKKTSCARPSDSSHFPPTKTEGPIIHNIRSNPAIRTVIDALEDHKTTPFRLSEKPKVPLKPKAFPGAGPKVPHKDQRSKADLEDQSMKLNKPFRRTLSITDPSRREADGVSSNALQLYNRLSLSNDIKTDFTCSSPKKQMPPQEFYETFEPGPPVMAEKDRLHGSSPPPPPRVQLGPSIPSPVNHAVADEHYKFVASAISKELLLIPRCNRHSHHDASPPVVDQTEEEGLYVTSDQFEVFKEVHENRSSSYDSDSSPASDILLPFEIKSDSNPRDQSGGNVDNSPHGERRKSALLPEKKVSGLNNAPVLRPLSSYNLLGPKPPKPARPPTVDLQKFLKKLQEERNLTVDKIKPVKS